MTITEGAWHYKPQARIKTVEELIITLVQTVGGGGNLLLNIGPMPDGRLEMFQKNRLLAMGRWLEKNGESIYETDGGPFKPNEYVASTRKGNKVYVHVLDWPENDLLIPQIDKKIVKRKSEEEQRERWTLIIFFLFPLSFSLFLYNGNDLCAITCTM